MVGEQVKRRTIAGRAFIVGALVLASGASLVAYFTIDREDVALAGFILAIPIIISALPLLFRSRAVLLGAVGLMTCWTLLGLASIGVFYIPATVALALAGLRCSKERGKRSRHSQGSKT